MRIALVTLSLIIVGLSASCTMPASQEPQLRFDGSVASDFRELADKTWSQFLSTFAARTNCFGDVTLRTDPQLDSRAAYDPKTATVTVRVPGSPAFLQAALVHEWAHHVEFQCEEHHALRPAILSTINLPPNTEWRFGHEWEDTPSEQYAEAVVELVLGEHPLPTKIRVDPALVKLLDQWANSK